MWRTAAAEKRLTVKVASSLRVSWRAEWQTSDHTGLPPTNHGISIYNGAGAQVLDSDRIRTLASSVRWGGLFLLGHIIDQYLNLRLGSRTLWLGGGCVSSCTKPSSCRSREGVLLLTGSYSIPNHSPILSQIVLISPIHSFLLSPTHPSQSPNSFQSISQISCNASIGAFTPLAGSDNAGPMTDVIQCSASASVHAMWPAVETVNRMGVKWEISCDWKCWEVLTISGREERIGWISECSEESSTPMLVWVINA